ncbi:type II 3-dehydroquinate dehydratase [Variovorax sp. RB2P76]|uniref:type II 3-dehydroquinate dehydratase n=1 Tax=Variovorax sp. RB2P76 TaxID=3443736 RepID=UPI003F46E031
MKILMLHGINHNMLGKRDPKQYGTVTLAEIDAQLQALGKELRTEVESVPPRLVDRRTAPPRRRDSSERLHSRNPRCQPDLAEPEVHFGQGAAGHRILWIRACRTAVNVGLLGSRGGVATRQRFSRVRGG